MRNLPLITFLCFLTCVPPVAKVQSLFDLSATAQHIEPTADPNYVPKISFEGEVSDENVAEAVGLLKATQEAGAKSVVLEINTPGGSVSAGFILAKAIEASPVPVVCVVDGEADSMGFYILQSCQIRLMTHRSALMAHQPAIGGGGGQEEVWRSWAEALRVLGTAMTEHMSHRMKVGPEEMERRIAGGAMWWFDWKDALRYGAVDGVTDSVDRIVASLRKDLTLPPMTTEAPDAGTCAP